MTQATTALVRAAVRQQSPSFSLAGALDRLFCWWFSGFVYNQIWEDPRVDLAALELAPDSRVLTIASGGCNILHYLLGGAGEVAAVDLNRHHVALSKLKLAAAAALPDHETFFRFFGHGDDPRNPAVYQKFVAPLLDGKTRAYFAERTWPLGRPRIDMLAAGLYDRSRMGLFLRLSALICRAFGKNPALILKAETAASREAAFERELGPFFDSALVRFLGSHAAAVFSLGIPPRQFAALRLAHPGGVVAHYRDRVRRLACGFDTADNYFAWQAFSRGYDRAGRRAVPEYLKAENFERLKAGAHRASVVQTSLDAFLEAAAPQSLDRFVLLDSQDWMTPDKLCRLWTLVARAARPGARVIFRTAGKASPLEGALSPQLLRAFARDDELSRAGTEADRSAIYGGFHVYRLADRP